MTTLVCAKMEEAIFKNHTSNKIRISLSVHTCHLFINEDSKSFTIMIFVLVFWKGSNRQHASLSDAKGLTAVHHVESLREKVYASLEEYCKTQYSDEPGRFAKLLLRLPALRSIGLKCIEHLFFFKMIGNQPIDTFLMEMLETPAAMTGL